MSDGFVSAAVHLTLSHATLDSAPLRLSALADTGASVSLIDVPLQQKLEDVPVRESKLQLHGLGVAKTCGRATVSFTIDGHRREGDTLKAVHLHFTHEFHLMENLRPGIILGMDFLFGHGIRLEPRQGVARMGEGVEFSLRCLRTPTMTPTPSEPSRRESTSRSPSEPAGDPNERFPDRSPSGTPSEPAADRDERFPDRSPSGTPSEPAADRDERFPDDRASRSPSGQPSWNLSVRHDVTVEPGSERWVPCQWDTRPPPDLDIVIEPALWMDENRDACFVSKSCLAKPSLMALLISNPGDQPVVVPSNLPITSAAPCGQVIPYDTSDETVFAAETDDPETTPSLPRVETHPTPVSVGDETRSALVDGHFHVGRAQGAGLVHEPIVGLLREFADCFSLDGVPGKAVGPELRVDLEEGARMVPEAPRRVNPEKRAIIDEQIEQLLQWDVIEPSTSCTSYPVLLIKQGPKWRFCVDFRGLNTITVTDRYPLPQTDDIFGALSESRLFSVLDAVKGFNQLPVHPDDRHKLAFVCHKGLYQYKRMPFGIKNGPAWFQRFMDRLLGALRWNCAMVYLDDVVVFTRTLEEHVDALRKLFLATRKAGLWYDPKKCHFAVDSIKLLGRCVSEGGVSVLQDRVQAILDLARPRNQEELSHFLGLVGYYSLFIARFAQEVAPLRLLQKGVRYVKKGRGGRSMMVLPTGQHVAAANIPLEWGMEQDTAFSRLKELLSTATTLALPVWWKHFFLYIDASQSFFACALHQQFLQTASPAKPTSTSTDRPTRSAETVHFHAIALSLPWRERLIQEQQADPNFGHLYKRLKAREPVQGYALVNDVMVRCDTDCACLPKALFPKAFEEAHKGHFGFIRTMSLVSSAFWHPRLAEGVRNYVKHCPECVRTREERRKGHIDESPLVLGIPFHTISVDLILGLPPSQGMQTCLIIVDTFTKVVLLRPMPPDVNAKHLAHAIGDMVLRIGWTPRRMISDHDSKFIGRVGKEFADTLGITLTPSAPYHQQANPVERYVQTAIRSLRALCLDKPDTSWVDLIGHLELSLNITPSTVTGYEPYDLLYVHRPGLLSYLSDNEGIETPEEAAVFSKARLEQAIHAVKKAQEIQRQRYNSRRQPLAPMVEGMLVMIRLRDRPMFGHSVANKLATPLAGPFRVKEVLSPHRVRLALPKGLRTVNEFDVTQLQVVPENDTLGRPGLRSQDEEGVWEPERIVDERMSHNKHRQYLVKWKQSDLLEWSFEDDLLEDGCEDIINNWEDDKLGLGTPPLDPRRVPSATVHLASASRLASAGRDIKPEDDVSGEPLFRTALEALHKPLSQPKRLEIEGRSVVLVERPVAFASRPTSPKESKMKGLELEATGLLWAFHHYRHLLQGAQLTVITDHSPLGSVMKAASHRVFTPRLEDIRAQLAPYLHQITFVHKAGDTHVNVDSLSRLQHESPLDRL
ncbi:unnamed protein product [Parajaminaea phylloscopi]